MESTGAKILDRIKDEQGFYPIPIEDLMMDNTLAINQEIAYRAYDPEKGFAHRTKTYYLSGLFNNGLGEFSAEFSLKDKRSTETLYFALKVYSDVRESAPFYYVVSDIGDNELVLVGFFSVKDDSSTIRQEHEVSDSPVLTMLNDNREEGPFKLSLEFVKYVELSGGEGKEKRVGYRVFNDTNDKIGFVYKKFGFGGDRVYCVDVADEIPTEDILEDAEILDYEGNEFEGPVQAADALYIASGGEGVFSKRTFVDVPLPGL